MIKKKYQMNRNEKCVDKAQQCFAFLVFTHQAKIYVGKGGELLESVFKLVP